MAAFSTEATYLSPGQAARILGVSPKTVNRWANEGRIPCAVTLGGHRRFRVDVIRGVASSMGVETGDADAGAVGPSEESAVGARSDGETGA
jgi:excisionase family DNA binding protein